MSIRVTKATANQATKEEVPQAANQVIKEGLLQELSQVTKEEEIREVKQLQILKPSQQLKQGPRILQIRKHCQVQELLIPQPCWLQQQAVSS